MHALAPHYSLLYVYQSIAPLKKANSTLCHKPLNKCLCPLLAEQVFDPCNLSKKIPYHLFQLFIVDSLMIYFNCMDAQFDLRLWYALSASICILTYSNSCTSATFSCLFLIIPVSEIKLHQNCAKQSSPSQSTKHMPILSFRFFKDVRIHAPVT